MRGITRTLAVSAAALLLALPGRAVDAPTPDLSFSFTNSTAPSRGDFSWYWNNGDAVYVDSLRTESDGTPSKAVTISDACHPGNDYTWPAAFSVMSYIKVTDAPDKGTVASFGNGCFLLKQNATTMRFGTASAYVDATAENLSTGWHLVVAKCSASGLSIQIDGGTAVTGRTAIEVGGGFQVGTRWGGPLTNTALLATNLYIDELAIYNSVLSDEQVAAVVAAYPAALPPTYTADLSTSSEATVNYSALPWDVGGAPGANAEVIIKTPAAGITITMDQATSAFELLTVQGSGKLTFAADSGVTGTALSTNGLVAGTDVDVSAINSSLGSVTVAADKTLTTGENTTVSGVTFDSATAKVKVTGSTALSGIPYGMQTKTGTVEIEPKVKVNGEWAFNTVQTINLKVNVEATRLVTGDGWYAHTTLNQLGGTITLSSEETSCAGTTNSAILLGHWDSATVYNLQAGTLSAPNGALCLGWDGGKTAAGGATLTIGQSDTSADPALLSVYRLAAGERNYPAAVTINPTGTVQVGEGGVVFGKDAKSVTLAGGTLLATATTSANIAHTNGLNVTAPSTIAAAPSAILTINKVSGAGDLTIGTVGQTGTVVISDVSAYTGTATASAGTLDLHSATFGGTLPTFAVASGATLILPAGKEGAIAVPDEATLTLVLSSTQMVSGYATTVTSGSATFKKVGSDGALVEITNEDGTIENGTFTPSLNTWTAKTAEEGGSYTWRNAANWSKGAVPEAGDSVKISVTAEGTTLTLGSAVTVANVSIAGEGTLTLAGEALTVSGSVVVSANTTAVKDKFLAGAIQIEDGKTLTVSTDTAIANVDQFGATNALALPVLTGTGTLIKEGTGVLGLFNRSAEPTIQVKAGTLHVRAEPTTAMKLAVEDGATVNFTAWATSFNNSLNSFALKGGSSFILGNGLRADSPQSIAGAMTIADATDEKPAKIYGSAFGPVTLNMPISGTGTVEFADGGTFPGNSTFFCDQLVTVSGVISGGIKVKVTEQANAVVFSGANTYTGGTDIAAGATLKVSGVGTIGSGKVTGSGALVFDGKKPTITNGLTENTWQGTVKIASWTEPSTGHSVLALNDYGSDSSIVELDNVKGYLSNGMNVKHLKLSNTRGETGFGFAQNNGSTQSIYAVTINKLSGDGTFNGPEGAYEWKYAFTVKDCEEFSGSINLKSGGKGGFIGLMIGSPIASYNHDTYKTHITVLADGVATIAENATWAPATGAGGKTIVYGTLSGKGTIDSALTLADGAKLDVTNGALRATGTVTIADGATVTVMLPESPAAGTEILKCSNPAAVAAKLTGAPDGLKFAANAGNTAVVLAIVIPSVDEVALSAESQATLLAAAEAARLTSVTAVSGSTTVNGTETRLTAAQIDNALAVFGESIVTADGTTLKVDYDFGISEVYQAGSNIEVKAKVQKSNKTAATISNGVTLTLVDGDGATLEDSAQTLNEATQEVSFTIPVEKIAGKTFKVKATKE